MKVMSFNTQHCLDYTERRIDFQLMADAIKACDPNFIITSPYMDSEYSHDLPDFRRAVHERAKSL